MGERKVSVCADLPPSSIVPSVPTASSPAIQGAVATVLCLHCSIPMRWKLTIQGSYLVIHQKALCQDVRVSKTTASTLYLTPAEQMNARD